MSYENDYVPFATGAGANVLTPAQYAALTARQLGFQSGIATSQYLNTVWRQASVVAAMIAQFTSDNANVNVIDDGNVATLETNFEAALANFAPLTKYIVHYGLDVSGSSGTLTTTVAPSVSSYIKGALYEIIPANNCSGATVANISSLGNRTVTRRDGAALQALDYIAGQPILLADDGTQLRVLTLVPSEVSSNSTLINYINKLTPAGATQLSAFTAGVVETDVAVSPSFTTCLTTGNLTGATYIDASATCAVFDNATSGTVGAATARISINDVTASTSTTSEYVGGGSQSQGTQVALVVPRYIANGLNPAHTYNLSLLCQKGSGAGQAEIFDTYLFAQHNGTNL